MTTSYLVGLLSELRSIIILILYPDDHPHGGYVLLVRRLQETTNIEQGPSKRPRMASKLLSCVTHKMW